MLTEGVKLRIMATKALIFGIEGETVSPQEEALFAAHPPWGFIIFARNIRDRDQVAALTARFREIAGRADVPILVDQEGGRVQRFRAPHWYDYPSAAQIGQLYRQDEAAGKRACWLLSRLHAFDLSAVGVNVDCLPVLDVPTKDGHGVIGDRAYGDAPDLVANLGRSACDGLLAGGVKPVIKHIPGHGRATADSHFDLPVVNTPLAELDKTDFHPFAELADIPMAMTAHVIYSTVDDQAPATTSRIVMDQIIRQHLGYDGLVMCDDITMNALSGDLSQRTHAIFEAGCDIVLHCTGIMEEMQAVAEAGRALEGKAKERADRALIGMGHADNADEQDCREEFADLMAKGHSLMADGSSAGTDPTAYGPTGRA